MKITINKNFTALAHLDSAKNAVSLLKAEKGIMEDMHTCIKGVDSINGKSANIQAVNIDAVEVSADVFGVHFTAFATVSGDVWCNGVNLDYIATLKIYGKIEDGYFTFDEADQYGAPVSFSARLFVEQI